MRLSPLPSLLVSAWALSACTASAPPDPADDRGDGPTTVRLAEAARGADLAASGDELVITWTEDADDIDRLVLARWAADGPLQQATVDSDDVVVGLARRPSAALGPDGTAWVTFTSGDVRASSVWLVTAPGHPEDATAEVVIEARAGEVPDLLDQPEVRVAPDGDRWLLYKAQIDHPTVELQLARASTGWQPEVIAPFPGRPCECCPHQLDFTPDGDALLTIRNDQANLREIWVARAEAGTAAFDRRSQASSTGWIVQGCPFDGPRLSAAHDPSLVVTWVDATTGAGRPWLARSVDGGATWSTEEALFAGEGDAFAFPLVAHAGDELWVAAEELWEGLYVAVDRGEGFERVVPRHVTEEADLLATELGVFVVGLDADGALWLEKLSDAP